MSYIYKIKSKNRRPEVLIQYGFSQAIPENEEDKLDEEVFIKTLQVKMDTPIGEFVKKNFEAMYKEIQAKGDEEWLKALEEGGAHFTEDGILKVEEGETFPAHLCVFTTGINTGILYLSIDSSIEFVSTISLDKSIPEEIKYLKDNHIIYKKEYTGKELD